MRLFLFKLHHERPLCFWLHKTLNLYMLMLGYMCESVNNDRCGENAVRKVKTSTEDVNVF